MSVIITKKIITNHSIFEKNIIFALFKPRQARRNAIFV